MENLHQYITHPLNLGRQEADSLELIRDKHPYFQALHILIAKCHKNQNTFGYNKNLKLASLYAGDRKVLFNFINSEPPPAEEKTEEKVNENVETIAPVIEEPILVSEQPEVKVENPEIEEYNLSALSETKPTERDILPDENIPKFIWDEELQAYKKVKEPGETIEALPEKKPIFEVVNKEEPTPGIKESAEIETIEPGEEKPDEAIEESDQNIAAQISEEITTQSLSPAETLEIVNPEEQVTEKEEETESAHKNINLESSEAEEPEINTQIDDDVELTQEAETMEEILVKPIETLEEITPELLAEPEPISEVSEITPLEIEDNAKDEPTEDIEEVEAENKVIDSIDIEEITEEPVELNEWVPETEKPESTIAGTDSDDGEQDFFKWLDNFALADTKKITEDEPKLANFSEHEEKISTEAETTAPEEIVADDSPIVDQEPFHSHLPLNFEEIEETEDEYDPAAWAEIAYDIQAFVKTPEVPEEKHFTVRKVSKDEIDDLLDRFIKKNPSISRPKAEFYKPENMARKSEEFHGEVASETLAQLFYKQGHLHKSLEIYEKLMLQNPDKKDIFAARIKSIKDELINRL